MPQAVSMFLSSILSLSAAHVHGSLFGNNLKSKHHNFVNIYILKNNNSWLYSMILREARKELELHESLEKMNGSSNKNSYL
jgi:hypothetical protein